MNFSDATLLSVSRKSQFWGDTVRYKSTLELSVEGLLLNLTNTEGVSVILEDLVLFAQSADNWTDIILNGRNFGQGLITSVNFEEGNDVRDKKYTVSITIPITGDLSSVFGGDYSGLSYPNIEYIEEFSENSSYTRNIQKESYSQSVSFSIKGPYSLDAVEAAKDLAEDFFKYNDLINTIGNKYSDSVIFRKFYTEGYDKINNKYTFSRNYDTSLDSNGEYSVYFTHSLTFDGQGIASIREKADYTGHTSTPFDTVSDQAKIDIASSYTRCNNIFTQYFDNDNADLLSDPITTSWASIPFEGKISYDIQYTNSNRLTNFGCFWNYQISVEKPLGGNYIITENGDIVGLGHMIETKYQNALTAWRGTIESNILTRVQEYYSGELTMKLMNDTLTLQKVQGKITYSKKYSDSDSLLASTEIRKAVITVSKDFNRNLATSFNIINEKEIIQVQPNLLPNNISYSINMNGKATTSIGTYLSAAKSYISLPSVHSFISDSNYSYDPFSRTFSLSASIVSLPTTP